MTTSSDPDNFLVFKSSAGSGKTFTLVKEYLKIVLADPSNFWIILGLTFTNKAANEMKDRVLQYLQELEHPDLFTDSKIIKFLLPAIMKETGLERNNVINNARIAHSSILHNYSYYSIGTIDSFMHKVFRTFAFDLGIPIDFNVELDDDLILNRAVDSLIERTGREKLLTDFLIRFVSSKLDEEKSWKIENEIKSFAKNLLNEEGQINLLELAGLKLGDFRDILSDINHFIKEFENRIIEISLNAVKCFQKKNLDKGAFYYGVQGIAAYFFRLSDGNFSALLPNLRVQTTINDDKWFAARTTESEKNSINEIKPELIKYYTSLKDYLDRNYGLYKLLSLVKTNIYSLALINEIDKHINDLRMQNNQVHISEFNKRILDIVIGEPLPYIYERLGIKYKHFLIDEFQDTSFMQWQNILPLIDNSLSEGRLNILVGDGKQAIYRWRNGDIEQFIKLPKIYTPFHSEHIIEREQNLINNYNEKPLNSNFRSKTEIVAFNNDFFETIKELLPEKWKIVYDKHSQKSLVSNTGGYVCIKISEEKDKKEFDNVNLDFIVNEIKRLQTLSYRFNDMAVLCRKNDQASMVAEYLLENGIDVISSEALLLRSSHEVKLIIALIHLIVKPLNRYYQYQVLTYFYINNKLDLNSLCGLIPDNEDNESNGQKEDSLSDMNKFRKILKDCGVEFNPDYLKILSLYDLVEEIIRSFHLVDRPDPYLEYFLQTVYSFAEREGNTVSGFLEWWSDNEDKLSVVFPEGNNAVTVMTVHKAKGLEFPVIFLPFANEKLKQTKNTLWLRTEETPVINLPVINIPNIKEVLETGFAGYYQEEYDKSAIDMLNLLYVAMTRPIERLYVITQENNKLNEPLKSVSGIINYYLTKKELSKKGDYCVEFGDAGFRSERKETRDKNEFDSGEFISVKWQNRITISLQSPEKWDARYPVRYSEWGVLVHEALSYVHTINDRESALDRIKSKYDLSAEVADLISDFILKLLKMPGLRDLYQTGVSAKNEAELLTPEGLSIRPDRLVFNDDVVSIIEYKTGRKTYAHTEQVNNYEKVLQDMNFRRVDKYLVYISEMSIDVEKV